MQLRIHENCKTTLQEIINISVKCLVIVLNFCMQFYILENFKLVVYSSWVL